ncbi:MAG TPA: DUF2231 domain-containing protein [Gemmatimonadaceae bacterium]|nr:DUF2231 domain-containing protein [Gemmatimonadaceae bacterium]
MPNIGFFHPQIVHFVIAGLLLGIAFRWVSLTGKLAWTDRAATVLLVLGTIAAVFAVMSGTQTHELSERIPGVALAVQAHEDAGHDVRNLFLVIAALELLALVPALMKWRRWLVMASAALCVWGAYEVYEVGDLGGDLVYEYAGGVGTRSGDSTDVNNVMRSALFNRAMLDRQQKNAAAAAQDFAELAARFPNDPQVQLAAIGSMVQDKHDGPAALAALAKFPVPDTTSRLWGRYQMTRVDAFQAAGMTDSARAVLQMMIARRPGNPFLKARLEKLK